jgi:hypothetical protein
MAWSATPSMEQTLDMICSDICWESMEALFRDNEGSPDSAIITDDTSSAFLCASDFPVDPLLHSVGPQDSGPGSPTLMPLAQHDFPSVWGNVVQQSSASQEGGTGRPVGAGPALSSSSYASPSRVGDLPSPRSTSTSSAQSRKPSLRGKKKEQ